MCRYADYSLKKLVASEDEEVKSKTFYPQNYFKSKFVLLWYQLKTRWSKIKKGP